MEALLDVAARLRRQGFTADLDSLGGGRLRGQCGHEAPARDCRVTQIERFEGTSNPDDESILIAVELPCGHRGLLWSAYGAATDPDQAEVLRQLPPPDPHGFDRGRIGKAPRPLDEGGDPACWAHLFDSEY